MAVPMGAWFDVVGVDALFCEMVLKRVGNKLRSIVAAQINRATVL